MNTSINHETHCTEHPTDPSWPLLAGALAAELAAVRHRIVEIERLLQLHATLARCPACRPPAPARRGEHQHGSTQHSHQATPGVPCPAHLTEREVEVLRLAAAGKSNREMAVVLSRSERTIERHLENLYRKISARNRADAVAFAIDHGLR